MIEQINSTTWQNKLPSGEYAYIGNPDSSKLEAHFKGTRFGGESGIGLGFPLIGDLTNVTPKIDGDTFELAKGDYKVRLFPDNNAGDKGGYEFELWIGKKPPVNFFELPLDTQNAVAYHQPAPTAQEITSGVNRPDDIVNSYAFYHPIKSGNSYQAGKAFHLKRAWARDALGAFTWLEQSIVAGKWRVTDKNLWLFDSARVYPIVIGPTFGYDTIGASTQLLLIANYAGGAVFTSPSDIDTVQSVVAYIRRNTASANIKGLLVLHSDLTLVANGVGGASVYTDTPAWITSTFASNPTLAASTAYILAVVNEGGNLTFNYDAGDTNQGHYDATNSYTTPADWGTATHTNNKYSIYATYTAVSGFTPKVMIF